MTMWIIFLNKHKWLKYCSVYYQSTLLVILYFKKRPEISGFNCEVLILSAVSSVCNMLLLLPPSVGSGGEQRLSWTALLHERNLVEDPEKEERQEAEQEVEKSGKVGEGERLKIIWKKKAHVAINIFAKCNQKCTQVTVVHYKGTNCRKESPIIICTHMLIIYSSLVFIVSLSKKIFIFNGVQSRTKFL